MFLAIRREGQTVSRMQEVAGGQEERVLAVDEHGNESWVPADRLTENGEAAVQQEVLDVEVQAEPRTTDSPENEEQPTEAVDILPQEPASYWSTMAGCCVVFFGLFWAVGQFIIAPSIWIGLLVSAPNFGPVMSFLAVAIWIGGYHLYLRRVYWQGRPWVPVLTEGEAQLREVGGRQFVYASRECGLPRVWSRSWIRVSAFPKKVECPRCEGTGRDPDDRRKRCSECEGAKYVVQESDDEQHSGNTDSADQAA